MRDDKQDENGWAASFVAAVIIIAVAYGLAFITYIAFCTESDNDHKQQIEWANGSTEW
jgi:hypothetical protein